MSTTTFEGNLTRDVALDFGKNDKATPYARFRVAENRRELVDGQWTDAPPTFHNVVAFNSLAENIANTLREGDSVIVHGQQRTRVYEKDGEERTITEVIATFVGVSLTYQTAAITRVSRASKEAGASEWTGDDAPAA